MRRRPHHRGPRSERFDGLRFRPHAEPPRRGLLAAARMVHGQVARPRGRPPATLGPDRPPTRVDALRLTLIGHSSLLLQVAGLNLLVDPVLSDRRGPGGLVGPRRAQPPGIRWEDLPPVDAVLLTHDHWDHLDGPTLARLAARFAPRVVAPLGNDAVVRRYAPALAVETLDWGGLARLSDRVAVHCEPALHWSGRGLADRRMALWGSFVVTDAQGGVLYHVGDTAYGDGAPFRRVRERFGPPDVALVPIGAYEPRWYVGHEHVDPEEAVRILLDCGARRAFGHHWGTFRLTWEAAHAPPAALAAALERHGVPPERFRPLRPGEAVAPDWPGATMPVP